MCRHPVSLIGRTNPAYAREVTQLPEDYERIDVPPAKTWHAWVLSDHYERVATGGVRPRTYLGDLLYRAKYCSERAACERSARSAICAH